MVPTHEENGFNGDFISDVGTVAVWCSCFIVTRALVAL